MDPSRVTEIVGRVYDREVESLAPLTGGETNELWTVATDTDRLVVRVSPRDRTLDRVQWEHDVLHKLRRHLPFVVAPEAAGDGTTVQVVDGQLLSVFPFVENASPMDPGRVEHRRARAAAMGMLHHVTNEHRIASPGTRLTPRWWGQWPRVRQAALTRGNEFRLGDDERTEIVALLDREHDHINAWIEATERRDTMPSGLIHGDLNHRNVLMSGDDVAAIVDWDGCRVEWYATEVAGLSPELLGVYVEAGGIADACDPDALQMLARFNNANEVLWVFNENGLSDELDDRAGDILRDVANRALVLQSEPRTGES